MPKTTYCSFEVNNMPKEKNSTCGWCWKDFNSLRKVLKHWNRCKVRKESVNA